MCVANSAIKLCRGGDETKRTKFQRKENTLKQNYLPRPACRIGKALRRGGRVPRPYCPLTRKKLLVLVMGRVTFCALVVAAPLHDPAGSAVVRSNTNGGGPPVQLKFAFVPVRVMNTSMAFVTVITTAS